MPNRRLAAIMFSDIVGYTALMGSDEDKAFEILRKNRTIHTGCIEKFNGTLIKEMGDGMLAQFNSAVDSVRCAIQIQKQANLDLDAKVRIGIHLGDITVENNDVFGDGVNIASRLQSIAEPGGIFISDPVYSAIRSKRDIQCQYLGEVTLKNVNYPFKTYFIKSEDLPVPPQSRIDKLTGKKKIKSVVVLPFDNYTGREDLAYFVSGMHASLIGSIGKVSGMRVISKTTANAYRDTVKSIPEIASELRVDAVIEASVLGLGEKINLQVKLVDAYPEEKQLWMEDYVEDKNQILDLYNEVTKEISHEINVRLSPEEQRLLSKSREVDREVYDAYLKSYQFWDDLSQESLRKGLKYLKLAVEKDPEFAPLYTGLAKCWIGLAQIGIESPAVAGPKIYEYLNKAQELDPDLTDSYFISAGISVWTEWDWEKGEKEFLKALEINPSDALSRVFYGHLLMIMQKAEEALFQAKVAVELDPYNPLVMALAAVVYCDCGDMQTALNHLEKALSIDPQHFFTINLVEPIAFLAGDYDKAFEAGIFMMQHNYLSSNEDAIEDIKKIYDKKGFIAAYEAITRQMEMMAEDQYINPTELALRFYWLKNYEKTMKWIEKGYEMRDQNMPYIMAGPYAFHALYDNPRFIAIVEKMNLPLPK
jgi:class 3 adenylate cyclase/TolB-like protein